MAANTVPFLPSDLTITFDDGVAQLTLGARKVGSQLQELGPYQNQDTVLIQDESGDSVGLRYKTRPILGKFTCEIYALQHTHAAAEVFEDWVHRTGSFAGRVSTNTIGTADTWTLIAEWTDLTGKYHRRTYTLGFLDSYDGPSDSDDGSTYSINMTIYGTETLATDRT